MSDAAPTTDDDYLRALPRGRHPLSREAVRASQRERLLEAMLEVAATKGYHAVTLSDIVQAAGTSRRVFYEQFEGKEDCFLAVFSRVAEGLLAAIAARFDPNLDQAARAAIVIDGFLDYVSTNSASAYTYFVGVNSLSPAGIGSALEVRRAIADLLVDLRREVRRHQPETPPLTQLHALAIVGAIHEIIGQELHQHGTKQLHRLRKQLVPLAVNLLEVPGLPAGKTVPVPPRTRTGG